MQVGRQQVLPSAFCAGRESGVKAIVGANIGHSDTLTCWGFRTLDENTGPASVEFLLNTQQTCLHCPIPLPQPPFITAANTSPRLSSQPGPPHLACRSACSAAACCSKETLTLAPTSASSSLCTTHTGEGRSVAQHGSACMAGEVQVRLHGCVGVAVGADKAIGQWARVGGPRRRGTGADLPAA